LDKRQQLIKRIMIKALKPLKDYSLKPATLKDLDIIWKIKEDCSIEKEIERIKNNQPKKGFILGCQKKQYKYYIQNADCYVMWRNDKTPVGYSVILPKNISLEGSTVTEHNIQWCNQEAVNATVEDYIYYDQYCIHPDYANKSLAFNMIVSLCYKQWKQGIKNVFGSVVKEPVSNENSHKVLQGVGMSKAAEVKEDYPGIGDILTILYYINADKWFKDI